MNLTLIRGLPGSGKTTTAFSMAEEGDSVFEADMFFIDAQGDYVWDREKIREAHEWCQTQTKNSLREGNNVFVSNTFTTLNEMRPYFEMAKEFGILPTVILCQNDWGSAHDVPLAVLLNMKKRFAFDISSLLNDT